MTKAIAQTYTLAQDYNRHILATLLAMCGVLLIMYASNVYSVISHTVALESVRKQSATLTTSIDALDAQYLSLSSKANPDTLKDYGYVQGQVSAFISRTTSLGTVATRAHEL